MADFNQAHAFTARWEGRLVDHPSDPGGITNYGVSLRWLRSLGYDLGDIDGDGDIDADDVRALTPDDAARLFRMKFWEPYGLGDLPQIVATVHYDCSVNTGPAQATRIAQRACNEVLGSGLVVDGKFGPKTRQALKDGTSFELVDALLTGRDKFYITLANQKPSLACFLRGWRNRVKDLRRYTGVVW